ncbi:MAG: hypothetical protein HYR57_02970 [Candidatus Koribacter versatilis]|nr:hypothetical protein [Candidatus Koribacter versatilis]
MAPPNAVPEGTTFLVRLEDKLDTRKLQPGKHFKVKLAEDLTAANGSIIPRGKKIKGHVSSVEQGLHARMLLSFDEIETNRGWVPLIATVTGVPGEHAVKQPDAEGEIERKGMSKRRVIEAAAVGAVLGTVTGAAAGGGKGAGIGAGAGAGVGALAGILTDQDRRRSRRRRGRPRRHSHRSRPPPRKGDNSRSSPRSRAPDSVPLIPRRDAACRVSRDFRPNSRSVGIDELCPFSCATVQWRWRIDPAFPPCSPVPPVVQGSAFRIPEPTPKSSRAP